MPPGHNLQLLPLGLWGEYPPEKHNFYVRKTINNIYKRFSGHKTTITWEETNNYLVQHCNNGTCSVSKLTITLLENLDLENFT
jgi:hypothetical protein